MTKVALVSVALLATFLSSAAAADKEILLIGDKPSHGPGQHEHNADVYTFTKWLNTIHGVHATAIYDKWPEDLSVLDKADAVVLDCDGGNGHPLFAQPDRLAALQKVAARGAGILFYHWCTEAPATTFHKEMLDLAGANFELYYSVNPEFEAQFTSFPKHPITQGVTPFTMKDEWYFNLRFVDGMKGITPILTMVPPLTTMSRPDGDRSGNADVRAKVAKGLPEVVAWAYNRPNGGRSVGFAGGHYHTNLANENFRKIVLNSILWMAKVKVPAKGVEITPEPTDLTEKLDPKQGRGSRGGSGRFGRGGSGGFGGRGPAPAPAQ
jgi:hypothetical protein